MKKINFLAISQSIAEGFQIKRPDFEKFILGLTTLLLMMVLLLVTAGSLFPLHLFHTWVEIETALRAGVTLSELELKLDFRTVAERLFAFIPLGFLIHRKLVQYQWRNATATATALVLLIALIIELSQAVISIRHPLLSDLILAVMAGMVGIYFSISTRQILIQPLANTLRGLFSGVLVLGNYIIVCAFVAAIVPASMALSGWDCRYPLLVGNELTHSRPWQGKIRGLALYPRELTQGEIRRLSQVSWTPDNTMLRKTMGAFSLYSFAATKGNRVLPLGNDPSSTPLIIKKEGLEGGQLEEGVLQIHNPMFVKSMAPTESLCQAILTSQAFTLETEIASTDLTQTGPARIISNSINTDFRNFTLGEKAGDLVLRVRTLQNGANGSKIVLQTDNNVLAGGWHHVVASYAHGVAKFFVDGKKVAPALHYDEFLFLGTMLTTRTVLAIGLLLLIMGSVSSVVFYSQGSSKALLLTIIATSAIPLVVSFSLELELGRHLSLAFFGAVLLMPLPGFLLGWKGQKRFIKAY